MDYSILVAVAAVTAMLSVAAVAADDDKAVADGFVFPANKQDEAAFEREESDLQVVGIDDRNLNGGIVGDGGGAAGVSPRVKLTGPNVCTQQEP